MWLEGIRDVAVADGAPLDAATLASLDRGLADVAEGRVKPLDEYERERGLCATALIVRWSNASVPALCNSPETLRSSPAGPAHRARRRAQVSRRRVARLVHRGPRRESPLHRHSGYSRAGLRTLMIIFEQPPGIARQEAEREVGGCHRV